MLGPGFLALSFFHVSLILGFEICQIWIVYSEVLPIYFFNIFISGVIFSYLFLSYFFSPYSWSSIFISFPATFLGSERYVNSVFSFFFLLFFFVEYSSLLHTPFL